ncbi:MAG: FmdB family zinc ribbon protein [Puniceicoccales bacterium]
MPTYDYHCAACDTDFEFFQSMRDDPLDQCPHCSKKGKVKRMISSGAGIIFKGSGFYETDYKRSGSGAESGSGDSAKKEPAAKDAKPAKESSKTASKSTD